MMRLVCCSTWDDTEIRVQTHCDLLRYPFGPVGLEKILDFADTHSLDMAAG